MRATVFNILASAAAANAQFGGYGPGGNNGGYGGDGSDGDGNDSDGSGGFGGGPPFDISSAITQRRIHGVLASLAFVAFFPIGSIFMRVIPGRYTWIIHGLTQILGYIVYIGAAALGIHLVQTVKIPPNNTSLLDSPSTNYHPIIGLILLAVLFFQPILGYIHHVKFKRVLRRTTFSHFHIWIGRIFITLGIINGGLGLHLAGASKSAIVVYSVIAAIVWLIWALCAITHEVKRSRAARKEALLNQSNPSYVYAPGWGHHAAPAAERAREGDIEMPRRKRRSGRSRRSSAF